MDEERYITERVNEQISWYGSKSISAQLWFKRLRGFEILAAASIPVIAGFANDHAQANLILAVLGALIAISSALVSLNQLQENWIEYRTTCESLKREKYLYVTKAEPYHEDESLMIFVRRVESLLSKENAAWSKNAQSSTTRKSES